MKMNRFFFILMSIVSINTSVGANPSKMSVALINVSRYMSAIAGASIGAGLGFYSQDPAQGEHRRETYCHITEGKNGIFRFTDAPLIQKILFRLRLI